MNRFIRTLGVTLPLLAGACTPGARQVQDWYLSQLDRLDHSLVVLDSTLQRDPPRAPAAFREARARYKRVESLVEYYNPGFAKDLNGAPIPEVEDDDPNHIVIPPHGFQVVEPVLFPAFDIAGAVEAVNEVAVMRESLRGLAEIVRATEFTDANIWDAARLEIVRITTVGLSGFDSPLALRAVPEATQALEGVGDMLGHYRRTGAVRDAIREAVRALEHGGDFERFDRLAFLASRLRPIGARLLAARDALGIPLPPEVRAWRPGAPTPFDSNAFDPHFFAAPGITRAASSDIERGRALFFDTRLSRTGSRSCASCHRPELAFTDGRARSEPLDPRRPARLRNAPTIINAGLQPGSFYDLRTAYLEDQVIAVLSNPDEMHARFTDRTESRAIASFVRSMVALDAPFDRYLRGDTTALSAAQRRGYNLFESKARCGTCHFPPLFNGAIPPLYDRTEVEVLGVPERAGTRAPRLDPDEGRYAVTRSPLHRHAFKVPTLRNAELTGPYMHNGVFESLEDVIDFYDGGGGIGLGLEVPNQTLPSDSLRLTKEEKKDLVQFLRALTDTTGLSEK